MKKNGKCPAGQYYCYTDKKCKPIPKGFKVVGRAGMLRKENGHSVDDEPIPKRMVTAMETEMETVMAMVELLVKRVSVIGLVNPNQKMAKKVGFK